ncbi:minor tail protein [Mycobacterium phage DuncansLeg]|nr:minor tail protein [Mycobacterium phage DuncansLeg]
MSWDISPPDLSRSPARGWFPPIDSTPPTYSAGWWVVLNVENAFSVHLVTEAELGALLHLDMVAAFEADREAALRQVSMLVADRPIAVDRVLHMSATFQFDNALAVTVDRALEFTRTTGLDLSQVLMVNRSAGLVSIGRLSNSLTVTATRSSGLIRVAPLSLSRSVSVDRSADFAIRSNIDAAQVVTGDRALELARINFIDSALSVSADRYAAMGRPPYATTVQQFSSAGSYSYTIPRNCDFIDVVLLGGGGGGRSMPAVGTWGQGGRAGTWQTYTLVRGVDIPFATTVITGSVGTGGAGGAAAIGSNPGQPGGATTAVATGWAGTHSAAGGAGGGNTFDPNGQGPGDLTYNGQLYDGGEERTSLGGGQTGNPPGGGGTASQVSVGFFGTAGGAGAPGAAWFRAYQ